MNMHRDQQPDWKDHWESIYAQKNPGDISWYQSHPQYSLSLIGNTSCGTAASIIDVGGGASTLIDHLLEVGYRDLTVLDIARTAIRQAQDRLGDRSQHVTWIEGDVTGYTPAQTFDIWHDRAVFHFLTVEHDRECYLQVLDKSLKADGQAIIATFAYSGPSQSSGLDVVRYSPESLSKVMGPQLRLIETLTEDHHTADGGLQQFVYCRFCRNR
jgi:SAM-dependent methyltransferase